MQYYYTKSTNGFYIQELHGDLIPQDAIAISEQIYHELFAGQAEGHNIMPPDSEHSMPWLSAYSAPDGDVGLQNHISEIKAQLNILDTKLIRPLEFIITQRLLKEDGKLYQDWSEEQTVIDEINREREILREEMHVLEGGIA